MLELTTVASRNKLARCPVHKNLSERDKLLIVKKRKVTGKRNSRDSGLPTQASLQLVRRRFHWASLLRTSEEVTSYVHFNLFGPESKTISQKMQIFDEGNLFLRRIVSLRFSIRPEILAVANVRSFESKKIQSKRGITADSAFKFSANR